MKVFSLVLCLIYPFQGHSYGIPPSGTRLAMGFYYPALNNISSKTDIQISLNFWMKELTNTINLKNSYAILFDDISKMSSEFQKGNLDMVIAPPLLLAIKFDRKLLSNGFMGVRKKDSSDKLIIISTVANPKNPVNFLGKNLILPSDDLLAKLFIEKETLTHYNKLPESIFSNITHHKKSQRIILDLFFGKSEIAVVYKDTFDLMVEMNPQVSNKLKIIKTFDVKSRNYGFFHRDYQYQTLLKQHSGKFSAKPRGKQILEVFKTTEISASFVSDLVLFDQFYQSYLELKKRLNND